MKRVHMCVKMLYGVESITFQKSEVLHLPAKLVEL